MRRGLTSVAAMATLCALAACGALPDHHMNRPRPVFSPNGEILASGAKGSPACPAALGGWWDKLAAANGGVVTRKVFLADADRQFSVMDLDHDGFITPSELSDYRAPIEDTNYDNVPPPGSPPSAYGDGRHGNPFQRRQILPQIPADMADPVMSADKGLTFKVTREEFLTQAKDVFAGLDKDHDGKLTRVELTASCPAR